MVVNRSSQSHMVDPDWIQIFDRKLKQRLPVCKMKVHVYVMCQCTKNSFVWCVIDNIVAYYTIIDFNEVDMRIYLPEKVIIHRGQ